jgi:hypothetical protein
MIEIKEHPSGVFASKCGRVFKEFNYHTSGYPAISYGGKGVNVHRIIAETFLPKEPGKEWVLHFDDNPKNNSLDNLRWGDREENIVDAFRNGRFKRKHKGRLKEKDYRAILLAIKEGNKQREIAEMWNVTEARISQIASNFMRSQS